MYDSLKIRGSIIIFGMGLVLFIFALRLFSIQVLSNEYKERANQFVIKRKAVIPPRGTIYYRNGEIYVSNSPMFEMKITPRELVIPDTSILEKHLKLSREEIREKIKLAKKKAPWREYVFAQYIEPEVYTVLNEQMWNFQGISFSPVNKRDYRKKAGANLLGYISEVSPREIEASGNKYRQGDMIGKAGIERNYDSLLRGSQGVQMVLKDVHNREVGKYKDGELDEDAIKGKDILLGIDADLQIFGEELMQNKRGSIVAIEPSSGEILSFVSAPSYDPERLTGQELQTNWKKLYSDTLLPLFNRPLMAEYPPGSIFKLPMALAALSEGVISPQTSYPCGGGFWRNKGKPGCRMHVHPLKLGGAIKLSCNAYFAATYMDYLQHRKFDNIYESFNSWYGYMERMGIGQKLGVDLPFEQSGLLPTTARYDNEKVYYGKNRWGATNIISNSIGQGEILMTPLQMANLAVIIANRGRYFPPHFVRGVREPQQDIWQNDTWESIKYEAVFSQIDVQHFEPVIDAMEQVVASGTATRARLNDINVCGKTGTVQNAGEDHAVFLGFAPKEKPLIAIAVIVENAGGGGSWAAPVASLMIEKYLRGDIIDKKYEEARIKSAQF